MPASMPLVGAAILAAILAVSLHRALVALANARFRRLRRMAAMERDRTRARLGLARWEHYVR